MPRLVLAFLLALALAAASAVAAEPESGSVSAAAPTTEWKGTAPGYGFSLAADVQGGIDPCEQPYCDVYTLEVKTSATLTIALTTDSGAGFTTVEVEKPDGTKLYNGGASDQATTSFKINNAPVGKYIIETETNERPGRGQYSGKASLAVASSDPPSGDTPPPSGSGGGGDGGTAPGAAPGSTTPGPTGVTLQTNTKSAKRGKRVKLAVTSSGPVSNVVAQIRKRKKVVATGKLARVSGKATISVKAKKALKAGSYTVVLRGTDSAGAKIGSTTKLKLKK